MVQCSSSSSVSCQVPTRNCKYLASEIFSRFSLKDEEFVSKTTNDSNIDQEKFPASMVRQLAKKMECSKSTAKHIKQVASVLQAAQMNLMRHQRMDPHQARENGNNIPTSPNQRVRRRSQVNTTIMCHLTKRDLIQANHIKEEIDVPSVMIPST